MREHAVKRTMAATMAVTMAACGSNVSLDAGAEQDAYVSPTTDAALAADTGAAASCPAVGGSYTWLEVPSATCDATTAKNFYGITLTQTGCDVTFESPDNGDNRFPLGGSASLDAAGAFTGASFTIATSTFTCDGTYVPAAGVDPARYDVVCEGACTFSIRYGE